MKSVKRLFTTIGVFFAFFLFGVLDNLKGPNIPFIIKDLSINYSLMGNILFIEYVGFLIATLVAGFLIFKFGLKSILLTAIFLIFTGIGFSAGIPTYISLLFGFLILGLGLGALEITANSTIVLLFSENKGMFLNLLSSCYGIGSMLVPFYAGILLSSNISWRLVFAICLIPILALIIYSMFSKFPQYENKREESIFSLLKSGFSAEMSWHYMGMCCYVAAEIGLAAWIVEYALKFKGQSILISSLSLSMYFGLLTAGRLLGSFIVDRVGYLRILLLTSIGAVTTIIVGIQGPKNLFFFLPATGFFFSIIFPTIIASFTEIKRDNIEKYLSLLFTSAGIGGMIGPWLIGVFADHVKLSNSISILMIYSSLMLISIAVLLAKRNFFEKNPLININKCLDGSKNE
jgi:fucose permease